MRRRWTRRWWTRAASGTASTAASPTTYRRIRDRWLLKLTYCNTLCERGDLGFTMESLERSPHILHGTPSTRPAFIEAIKSWVGGLG